MTATQLPSGSWRVRVSVDNVRRSFTAPTKEMAEALATDYINAHRCDYAPKIDVFHAINDYIDESATLSPTTLSNYRKIQRNSFGSIMHTPLEDLTKSMIQQAINEEACRISPSTHRVISTKTLRNEWGLVAAALASKDYLYNVKVPRNQRHIKSLPDPQAVLDAVIGSSIELPCLLAMWMSFTMSEIRGLKYSDIKGDYITINRVKVTVDTIDVVKDTAKNENRLRRLRLPEYIKSLITSDTRYRSFRRGHGDAFIVPLTQNQLRGRFNRLMHRHGLDICFHDLRHINVSVLSELGISDQIIMDRGGWSTDSVMKAHYRQSFSKSRQQADIIVDTKFTEMLELSTFNSGSIPVFCSRKTEAEGDATP